MGFGDLKTEHAALAVDDRHGEASDTYLLGSTGLAGT